MSRDVSEIHDLEPDAFVDRVHSFEHWFDSVEGYLTGLDHGHRSDLAEAELTADERERLIKTLCNYTVAETAALEASSGLVRIAPNHNSKVFLSTQVVDEGRHVEVILHRLGELGVENPQERIEQDAGAGIQEFRRHLLELVDGGEWEASIFAQNVILEAMEFTVFQAHLQNADPITADLLERIVKDERRHIGFGENELGRRLQANPRLRERIASIKQDLDPMVLATFEDSLARIGVPRDQRPALGRDYLQVVARLGFE
ncbi:MAG: ferritin-like domain-containing protein [Deltaproteobacteria bacterium]|nr:ferritin-like domain-containing protein [Deltaproteobacteria bacterium]